MQHLCIALSEERLSHLKQEALAQGPSCSRASRPLMDLDKTFDPVGLNVYCLLAVEDVCLRRNLTSWTVSNQMLSRKCFKEINHLLFFLNLLLWGRGCVCAEVVTSYTYLGTYLNNNMYLQHKGLLWERAV